MSCIRYKFKTALEYDKVTFDGLQISVSDLREKIMSLKKMNLSDNLTLDIMDAQTKKIYSDDNAMIPRNSTIVVMRVPKPQKQTKPTSQMKNHSFPQDKSLLSADELKQTPDLAGANASEEDKVRAMMSQAGEDYNPTTYAKFKSRPAAAANMKAPPPNYVCHRCNQKGHLIKYCPTNGDPNYDNPRLKRSSGIPNSHVSIVSSSDVPGAMLDRFGNVVVRKIDLAAAASERKAPAPVPEVKEEAVPPELTCSICKELVQDAVIINCCFESFCDPCIRNYLLENDFTCFACKESDVSPETLLPNKSLRAAAKKFQSRQAAKKGIALARGLPSSSVTTTSVSTAPAPTSFVISSNDSAPPLVVPSSALPLAPSLPLSAILSDDSALVTSTGLTINLPLSSDDSTSVSTVQTSTASQSTTVSSSSQEESNNGSNVDLSQKSSLSQSSNSSTVEQDNNPKTVSAVTNGGEPATGGGREEEDRTPPAVSTSRDRTPSPSAGLLGSAPSVLSSQPLLTTADSQISPPKPLITAPIVLPPPALHRFPPTHSQPPVLIPAFSVVPTAAPVLPPVGLAVNPFLTASRPNADPSSMMRLTELLAAADKRNASPPPLSAEEFYLQQKMFQNIAGGNRSRTPSYSSRSQTPYSSHSYSSRSPSPLYGRSRSPYSRTSGSGSKSHKRHHHRHRSSEGKGKRKRKEEEEGLLEKPSKTHKHKHHHKKKKRKHSHSSPLPPPKEDVGVAEGVATDGILDTPVPSIVVNGDASEGLESQESIKAKSPQAIPTDGLDMKTAGILVSKETDHASSPSVSGGVEGTDDPVIKLKKKKRHKEKRGDVDDLRSTLSASSSGKAHRHHHKRHKHHSHTSSSGEPVSTSSKHHVSTGNSSSSHRKKLKKSSH